MHKDEFRKLIGSTGSASDYIPVAVLLKNGYGVAGFFNSPINEGFSGTCILVNARLLDLQSRADKKGAPDFADFLEEVVSKLVKRDDEDASDADEFSGHSGKTVPLMALPLDELAVVYPVSQIKQLIRRMKNAKANEDRLPTFLDFQNKSVVIKALTTKLW